MFEVRVNATPLPSSYANTRVGKYTGATDTFVELKTSLVIRGPHDEVKFEKSVHHFDVSSTL